MKPLIRNILIFFAVLLLLAAAWYFRSIVVYILVSGVLSIMGRPLVDLFTREFFYSFKPVQKITSGLASEDLSSAVSDTGGGEAVREETARPPSGRRRDNKSEG